MDGDGDGTGAAEDVAALPSIGNATNTRSANNGERMHSTFRARFLALLARVSSSSHDRPPRRARR
jgi:hypothetical protein